MFRLEHYNSKENEGSGAAMRTEKKAEQKTTLTWEEAAPLYRQGLRRDNPWAPAWKIEEAVQKYRESFDEKTAAEKIAELSRLRGEGGRRGDPPFTDWLRAALDGRGWNQSDLARAIGVRPSVVSKWVNGHQRPETEQCARIGEAFGIDPKTVLRMAGHGGLWLTNFTISDAVADSSVRTEIVNLIQEIPEFLLLPVVPMLRGLAKEAYDDEFVDRMTGWLAAAKADPPSLG